MVFVWPFVWGLAAPSLTTFLCFPPSRLRAALFPTVFHRIFANGESSLAPLGALFVLPLLPCAAAWCMQSWELTPPPPCLITPAWLPSYQPPTSLPFHNLLVSGGFCRAGYLTSWILIPPHHQAGSLNHIVLQTLCDLYSLFMIRVSPSGAWPWFLVAGNVEVDKRVQQEFKIFGGLNVKWIQVYWSVLSCF